MQAPHILATLTMNGVATPNFNAIATVSDEMFEKVEVQFLNDYAGVIASIGSGKEDPFYSLFGVLGTKTISVGIDLSYHCKLGRGSNYNAGLNITNADLSSSFTLNNKGRVSAAYFHCVSPLSVGTELTHSFSSNERTVTFGGQLVLGPLMTVKARFNNFGEASVLVLHEWRPKSLFIISADVDMKANDKSSKVGLALVLKH